MEVLPPARQAPKGLPFGPGPGKKRAGFEVADSFSKSVRGPSRAAVEKVKLITGPYAALAKRGDFSSTIHTKSGEIFVSVRLAKKSPGSERPLVYLDGLAARRSRSDQMANKLRDEGGRTVIAILLKGQGETLLRDLQKNAGQSIDHDIEDAEQAKVVIDVLDALGVTAPVDVFGLSYGGAIAAATKREAPARVAHTLLVAPHVRSQAKDVMGIAAWQLANSPWNPFGNSIYRSAAKATLSSAFGANELFADHPGAFAEALFRLSMGIDENELQDSTKGMKNLHILVAAKDAVSPLVHNQAAVDASDGGSLAIAPKAYEESHDLVSASSDMVVRWVTGLLNPERLETLPPAPSPLVQPRAEGGDTG